MSNSSSPSRGIGLFGLLTIVFITLKLTEVITWSWFWVLSPLWTLMLIIMFILIILIILAVILK